MPLTARAVDHAGALGRADVEDHQRLIDQGRAGDGAADRLDLAQPRMGRDMVARLAVATLQELLAHPGDHAVVLGMHAHHQPVRASGLEHLEELGILHAQPVVGQEYLERAMAAAHQGWQLLAQDLWPGVAQDHVESVVDHGPTRRHRMIILDHPGQAHADMLGCKRDHGGGAAEGRRGRSAGEGVGVDQPRRRELLDVAVAVDSARKHQLAGGIDLGPPGWELLAERRDDPAADGNIGRKRAGGRCDGASADYEVVLWHGGLQVAQRPNPTSLQPICHRANGSRSEPVDHGLLDRHRGCALRLAGAQRHQYDSDHRRLGIGRAKQLCKLRCQRQADLFRLVRLG